MSTPKVQKISDDVLRKAIAKIEIPSDDAVLSSDFAALSRAMQAAVTSGKLSASDILKKLKQSTSNEDAPKRIFNLIRTRLNLNQPSPIEILASLYVPQDENAPLGLDHHYFESSTTVSSPSSASASALTGKIISVAVLNPANFNTSPVTSAGSIFIKLDTTQSGFGKLNRVTFGTEVAWQASMIGNGDYAWGSNSSGTLQMAGTVWLTIFVLDKATNKFVVPTSGGTPYSCSLFPPVQGERPVDSFSKASSGVFKSQNILSGQFIVDGGNLYVLGVTTSMRITNSFGGLLAGQPAPPPPQGVGWTGTLGGTVQYMQMTNAIIA